MINKKKLIAYTFIILIVLIFLFSYGKDSKDTKDSDKKLSKNRIVTIETNKGNIKFEIFEKEAPITSKNFIGLAEKKFYDGLKFHRVVPNFVIQGGDPKGDGTGGSSKKIKLEINKNLKHIDGAVAMARSQAKDSASSQFYITIGAQHFLDGNYAVFGRLVEGKDIVRKIQKGDIMKKITLSS